MFERFDVLFGPLGRTDQALFFGIPTGDDNGSLRLPAALEQDPEAMNCFEHRSGTAIGIDGSIDPGVAMVPDYNPVLGVLRAFDFSNNIPDGSDLVVLL